MQPINFLTMDFFFQDIFRISLPGGSMRLTSAAFNIHLTSLFAGKNVQKIAVPSYPTSRLNTDSATVDDKENYNKNNKKQQFNRSYAFYYLVPTKFVSIKVFIHSNFGVEFERHTLIHTDLEVYSLLNKEYRALSLLNAVGHSASLKTVMRRICQ